jgi:hypothetical protein
MVLEQDKILSKARKLKELADRGIDGEKETAGRMYEQYKIKHKLTDEQVKGFNKKSQYDKMNYNDFIKNNQDLYNLIGVTIGIALLQLMSKKHPSMRSKMNEIIDKAVKEAKKHK